MHASTQHSEQHPVASTGTESQVYPHLKKVYGHITHMKEREDTWGSHGGSVGHPLQANAGDEQAEADTAAAARAPHEPSSFDSDAFVGQTSPQPSGAHTTQLLSKDLLRRIRFHLFQQASNLLHSHSFI
nr:unnamed protein product [Digitaria exilis]